MEIPDAKIDRLALGGLPRQMDLNPQLDTAGRDEAIVVDG